MVSDDSYVLMTANQASALASAANERENGLGGLCVGEQRAMKW